MWISPDFFLNLGFDFKTNLKSKRILIQNNPYLNKKLENNLFIYKSTKQTNTSFYYVKTPLNLAELQSLREYVWNENKVDLVFYLNEFETNKLTLFYAKASPKLKFENCIIDEFNVSGKDIEEIEKIKHWQFDSGAFWLNYQNFLKKASYKSIDKELINTLSSLKSNLNLVLSKVEEDNDKKNEIVQALIDRTLYIKYLEDSHIINSYFYNYYFGNEKIDYKHLLFKKEKEGLNELFKIIHSIFNNNLFNQPSVNEKYLTDEVCELIYNSLNHNLNSIQLRLFDFQFNVIPVEFISYIYEIFLSDKQKKNGIYYTPKKLAQLIVDDVIPSKKIGKVLDPSCGSGMFLIVAFQKLLENSNEKQYKKIEDKIEFRTKLLSDNIFGIEKEITAQRFTLFSLSLQLFRDIDPIEIKEFISSQLKQNKEVALFNKHSFFSNIICENTLNLKDTPFKDEIFQYILGNPPFFEVKQTDKEISFINDYEIEINSKAVKAKDIVGKHQISQCFLIKIKDWSDYHTRFGFVSNSSNFYNDSSLQFQNFFYSTYNIETIYELSRVKKILFEKAKESVVAMIFSNQLVESNTIEYHPVDLGVFSEKPFQLLIIKEDKIVEINQFNLFNGKLRLRDFLSGNSLDRNLIGKLSKMDKLENYLNNKQSSYRGLERIENIRLAKHFNLSSFEYSHLSTKEKKELHQRFAFENYLSVSKTSEVFKPYIYSSDKISPFTLLSDYFININSINKDNFRRFKAVEYFNENKILLNRFGDKINAVATNSYIGYSTYVYSILLKENKFIHLITALLNSPLINYFLDFSHKKRFGSNFSNIDVNAIKKITIPTHLDEVLVKKISKISNDLGVGKYKYNEEVKDVLNELIFDLYNLSYTEKQRIRDYFLIKAKTSKTQKELEKYKSAFIDTVSLYLKNPIDIQFSNTSFNLIVAKIVLNENTSDTPRTGKTKKYILNQIFEENPNENFLASQEKIYGEDCVYIIKKDLNINWSETNAFEDGQDILKNIMQNG
jgi:type I restriction-modification system DNA methylase subunit